MTPNELRDHMTALKLGARSLSKELALSRNGERAVRRMLKGETEISAAFAKKVTDARKGIWPGKAAPAEPDDPRQIMDALAGRR